MKTKINMMKMGVLIQILIDAKMSRNATKLLMTISQEILLSTMVFKT